jgi:hypothetical protein
LRELARTRSLPAVVASLRNEKSKPEETREPEPDSHAELPEAKAELEQEMNAKIKGEEDLSGRAAQKAQPWKAKEMGIELGQLRVLNAKIARDLRSGKERGTVSKAETPPLDGGCCEDEELVTNLPDPNSRICVLLNIPNWTKVTTSTYLSNYQDWHRYLDHIDQYPVFQPDNPILIGAFSSLRDQQARLEGASLDLPEHKSPSPRPAKRIRLLGSEDSEGRKNGNEKK